MYAYFFTYFHLVRSNSSFHTSQKTPQYHLVLHSSSCAWEEKIWQLNQHVPFLRYATGQEDFFPMSHLPDNSAYSSLRSNPCLLHVHPHCIFVQITSIIHPKIISRKKVYKRRDQRGDLPSPLPCVDPSSVLIPSQTMPNPPIHLPSILHHSSEATHNTTFDQIWTSSHLFAFLDFIFIPNLNA